MIVTGAPSATAGRGSCAQCGTELAPGAVACPACHTLVHAERLRFLASRAEAFTAAGKLGEAIPHGFRLVPHEPILVQGVAEPIRVFEVAAGGADGAPHEDPSDQA